MIRDGLSVSVCSRFEDGAFREDVAGCAIEHGVTAALKNCAVLYATFWADGKVSDDHAFPTVFDRLSRIVVFGKESPCGLHLFVGSVSRCQCGGGSGSRVARQPPDRVCA